MRWFPGASSLLVRSEHEGASQLLQVDVDTAAVTPLTALEGDIEGAEIRAVFQDGSGSDCSSCAKC